MRCLPSGTVAVVALLGALVSCGSDGEQRTGRPPASEPASTPSVVASPPPGEDTSVIRIVDGDTIWVDGDVRVRLIGIDTPETRDPRKPVQCFGKAATRRITELIPPTTPIRLSYDAERLDRYGRTLAYVYRLSDGLFINAELLRGGFAVVLTVPPNVMHSDEFVTIERDARSAERGLWGSCENA